MSTEIAQNLKQLSDSCASSKNFFELKRFIEYKSKKRKKNEKIEINDFQGKIIFKNVNFAYPTKPKELVLNNFNLVIPSGKTTAIIGESGCGKSTIVNLIEKIYNPTSGEIILDDKINISKIKNKNYRKFIGYVSQEPVLFHDTIKNNILFGREIKDEKLLIEATKKACIYNFIQKQPKKFEHKIGVKGSNLSGGQKQRIAIARAILNNPNLLILDEATSALDIKSEKKIQKSINQLQNKITIIIIAHRLTTVKNVDNIIFLGKGGKILEQRNHEYLMK
jgi:ABC-type multidrug transport system fused ATPase/permease subunit